MGRRESYVLQGRPDPVVAALTKVLGKESAQAEIVVNPTTAQTSGNCTAGSGHACLRLNATTPSGDVEFFDPSAHAYIDPQRFTPPTSTFLSSTEIGLDLTQFEPGSDTIIDPAGFSWHLAAALPDRDNVRVLIRAKPSEATTGIRDQSRVALWIPFDAEVEDPANRNHACGCFGGACDTTLLADCTPIVQAAEDYGCNHVALSIKTNHFRIWFGLMPQKMPNCDPVIYDHERSWMANVPFEQDFDQPCLTVAPVISPEINVGPAADAGVELHVTPGACTQIDDVVCATLVECKEKATQAGSRVLAQQLYSRIRDNLEADLQPYFQSSGGVFKQQASTPCSLQDGGCPVPQMVGGSLTAIGFGWFANLFTKPDAHFDQRYLITDVERQHHCEYGRPVENEYGFYSCECAPLDLGCLLHGASPAVTGDIRFDYAVDTDGDGVDNLDDNCPNSPDQADADADGYGDACDPCPCAPDEHALNEDSKCDVCDGSINAFCDGYCQDNPPDNCPFGIENPDQANCNRRAEDVLGLPTRGDACDPVPCAAATGASTDLVSQFSAPPGNPWVASQLVEWRGVQWGNIKPATSLLARGETELAHCNCPSTATDLDQKIANCRSFLDGSNRCQIGNHNALPNATWRSANGAEWVSETTTVPGSGSLARNQVFSSAYELSDKLAQTRQAVWRFDLDFDLAGQPDPTDFDDMVTRASELDGLGWAHTRSFQGVATDTIPLPEAVNLPGASYSDAASHYFSQRPSPFQVPNVPPVLRCPPGAPCGFSAWPDQVCKVCTQSLLPGWLLVSSPAIVEVAGGLTSEVTHLVDPSLATLLEDPSLQLVPFAEPHAVVEAYGSSLEAVTLDPTTLQRTAVVYDGPDGLVGFPLNRLVDGDPPPEPRAMTASALDEMVYVVQADPGRGEQLLALSLAQPGVAPAPVALDGVDETTATPLALTYRAADRSLYLLDRIGSRPESFLRILRVDPRTGGEIVLARWRYRGRHDTLYLSSATPGELVLTASGTHRHNTLMMTLLPTGGSVSITGWIMKHGRLLAPPETRGQTGYSMLMAGRHHVPRVVDVPGSSLHRPARESAHDGWRNHGHPERAHRGHGNDHEPWKLPDDGSPAWCD